MEISRTVMLLGVIVCILSIQSAMDGSNIRNLQHRIAEAEGQLVFATEQLGDIQINMQMRKRKRIRKSKP